MTTEQKLAALRARRSSEAASIRQHVERIIGAERRVIEAARLTVGFGFGTDSRRRLKEAVEELESALDTTNREIRELDAQQRLKGASETLEKIVAECEGTQAAPVAARMLELYRNPEPAAEAASEAAAVEVPSEATEPFAEPEFNPEPGI